MRIAIAGTPQVAANQALAVAHADATQACRDLSRYIIRIALDDDGWHVDYELREPTRKGGGPHYVINSATGSIRSKRYEQ
jgi:hypothetical protein